MDEFERALMEALHREAAPEGFAERVVARAGPVKAGGRIWWKKRAFQWSLAAGLAATLLAGGLIEHRREQQIRGERAREELMLALRITGVKLHAVQERLAEMDREGGKQ